MQTFEVQTNKRNEMIDISSKVRAAVEKSGKTDGLIIVFVPHTTAAVTINENADPDVTHDILLTLNELFPKGRRGYQHAEGNSDSHVKCSLVGSSVTIILNDGKMQLGTWQGIYFCEFDGPRSRKVLVNVH